MSNRNGKNKAKGNKAKQSQSTHKLPSASKSSKVPTEMQPKPAFSGDAQTWQFEPLDTWFFRESRPLESVGGAQLTSQFPPPVRTLVGAIRTTIGDALGVNWQDYQSQPDHPLRAQMGSPTELAPLRIEGPYLMQNGQRLYPAPLVVMGKSEGTGMTRLAPSETPVRCDLGRVHLPKAAERVKPLDECWLTAQGLVAVLEGKVPSEDQMCKAKSMVHAEPRLGIALDGHARRPLNGLLYQTRHLRLKEGVSVGLTVRGLDLAEKSGQLGPKGVARLGGEGRLAAWSRHTEQKLPQVSLKQDAKRLMLTLLTPARFSQGWLPDGFEQKQKTCNGEDVTGWCGKLADRSVTLVCAVTGKPLRQGGWDMATHQPRDLYGLVPAGSCYFFELDSAEDAQAIAKACHGGQLGHDQAWGYGQVAVGVW
ncbi:hypothetical protein VITFI_CDS2134 [Vitreoscilla filiformis]|uniref:CRISPR-associated protein Cmr3 n=2 Tax=Vitreoscilla filiformis TaxID=63 RepID=A0A221KFT6_VITFI|nr:hypothetical protein VITFI_CDS2134 [Vitreoscilla filiformis]